MAPGARSVASRSDAGSVVASTVRTGSTSWTKANSIVPVAVVKTEGRNDDFVLGALKGGGNVSAALRGGPLSARSCQGVRGCKDVARECIHGINCPYLAKKIEAHLCAQYPKEGLGDPKATPPCDEGCQAVFRFIKELASSENIRALQVMATNLKPGEQRVLQFVRKHQAVLDKIAFVQNMLNQSKSTAQMEGTKEAPGEIARFLKEKELPDGPDSVAHLMDIFTVMEEFQPFMEKQRAEAAENANNPKKATMHGDSDAVDKFCTGRKMKGDRHFMKSVLQMSCAK